MNTPGAHLHFSPISVLYLGPLAGNRPHRHHALQLLFERKGAANSRFTVYLPEVLHQMEGSDASRVLLLLEPESDTGRAILDAAADPEDGRLQMLAGEIHALADTSFDPEGVVSALLRHFPGRTCVHDPRVERVFTDAKRYCRMQADTGDMAAEACLSPDRFRHLFREQTGMPLARYLAWRRVRVAGD